MNCGFHKEKIVPGVSTVSQKIKMVDEAFKGRVEVVWASKNSRFSQIFGCQMHQGRIGSSPGVNCEISGRMRHGPNAC